MGLLEALLSPAWPPVTAGANHYTAFATAAAREVRVTENSESAAGPGTAWPKRLRRRLARTGNLGRPWAFMHMSNSLSIPGRTAYPPGPAASLGGPGLLSWDIIIRVPQAWHPQKTNKSFRCRQRQKPAVECSGTNQGTSPYFIWKVCWFSTFWHRPSALAEL
jgi:hypothetical protein